MESRRICPVYPTELQTDPRTRDLQSPVTVDHSLIDCPRCQRPSWIGPSQRIMVVTGHAEALCILCMADDPEVRAQAVLPTYALNPGIDNARLRFPL